MRGMTEGTAPRNAYWGRLRSLRIKSAFGAVDITELFDDEVLLSGYGATGNDHGVDDMAIFPPLAQQRIMFLEDLAQICDPNSLRTGYL